MKKKTPLMQKPLFRVLSMFSHLKWRIIGLIVTGIVGITLFSFMPTFTANIFNTLEDTIPNAQVSAVLQYLVIFGLLALFNEIFHIFAIVFILRYEQVMTEKNVNDFKRKLDVVPISFLENFSEGDLARRVSTQAKLVVRNSLAVIYRISRTAFFFITASIAMFSISWILALVVISSLPLSIMIARFVSKRTQKHFNNNNRTVNEATGYVGQKIALHQFHDVHGIKGVEEEYEVYNQREANSRVKEEMAMEFNAIYITFIQNFYLLLVTVVFGLFFVNGTFIEFGILPAFLVFSRTFLANAVIVTETTNVLQAINARASMVFEILDYPDTLTEREHINVDKIGDIEFKGVTIIKNGEKLLNNINFTIPKGKSVAIVGATGGGKSRIVDALSKFETLTSGEILVNGIDLSEINRDSYYKLMGVAFEKPFLFKGSVAENLLYGVRRAMPEQVMNTTKKLGSHEFIEKLPHRYETELTGDTHLMTTSQKQALNIARTVLKASDLVIFSSAYSSVDTVTEKETFEKIMASNPKQTKIFVTNRLAGIEKCDRIYMMESGQIIEQGTHKELMQSKGKYYDAFMSN